MKHKSVYIIAEIGPNHNGSINNCFKLIDAAAAAGCNCVKFQFFKAKRLYLRSAGKLDWKNAEKKYSYDNIYNAVKSLQLPTIWIRRLRQYCRTRKIDFLSSVFDIKGADYLIGQGMKMIKLSSDSITNIPLIEHCARYKLPIIMSTGGATLGEIEDAVSVVNKYHNRLSLLHCSIKYPTALKECNLGFIKTLQHAFADNRTGYSDHTKEISKASVQAIYLDAQIIEKHITLDKKMEGPDHFFALEPPELKRMVKDIRRAELDFKRGDFKIDKLIYGSTSKVIYPEEKHLRDFAYMRLFAKRDIKQGEIITPADISVLRPGKKAPGLDPKYLKLIKDHKVRTKKDIAFEDPITWDSILT